MAPRLSNDLLEDSFNPFETSFSKEQLMDSLNQIDGRNIRTKFKNAQDPINLAFDAIENTSLKKLAKDFVKESFYDIVSFVSDICK